MSEGRRRLQDDGVRWAFEQWRIKHPGGSITEFFSRHKRGEKHRGHGHVLRRALTLRLRRIADAGLPPDARARARQDAERIKKELGDAAQ